MKKPLLIVASLFSMIILVGVALHAFAGGLSANLDLQTSSSSAPADGKTAITFKMYATYNGSPVSYDTIWITVAGTGYTLGGVTTVSGRTYVQSGTDGHAQFTMTSSSVGSDTVTVDGGDNTPSATVSFTAPVVAAPTPAPVKTAPPTAAATPAAAPAPTPPAAPTTALTLDGQAVAAATAPTVPSGKAITLSGTTVPNGVVTLYIFSTPRQVTVTADAKGSWAYQVTGLESGSHHVEATVTDPASKLTSDRVTLAKFMIAQPVAAVHKTPAKKSSLLVWIAVGAGVVVALLAGLLFWLLRRRHNKTTPPSVPTDITTPTQPVPPTPPQQPTL